MHLPFIAIFKLLQNKRWLVFALSLLLFTFTSFFALRLKLINDVSRFLPQSDFVAQHKKGLELLSGNEQLVLHFQTNADDNVEALVATAESVVSELRDSDTLRLIRAIRFETNSADFQSLYDSALLYAPCLLTAADYDTLSARLEPARFRAIMQNNYQSLLSPVNAGTSGGMFSDPLGIGFLVLNKLQQLNTESNFDATGGYLLTKDGRHLLVLIEPAFPAVEYDRTGPLLQLLHHAIAVSKADDSKVAVNFFGAHAVSYENAEQVIRDSLLTGVVGVALILAVLLLLFRNLQNALAVFIPVALSLTSACAFIYALRGQMVAIAAGAVSIIVGIGINYAIHMVHLLRHRLSKEDVIRELAKPLLIGNFTTVGAFLGLQFAQSPALQDFGLLASFSLIGCAFYTLVLLPHFITKPADDTHNKANRFIEKLADVPLHKTKWLLPLMAVCTLVAWYFSGRVQFDGDMMHLNYMSAELKQAEKELSEVSGLAKSAVYITATAASEDELIELNERLFRQLGSVDDSGLRYPKLNEVFVSEQTAARHQQLWQQFWNETNTRQLQSNLKEAVAQYRFKANAFDAFTDRLHEPVVYHSGWVPSDISRSFFRQQNGQHVLNLPVLAGDKGRADVRVAASKVAGVMVIDRLHFTSRFVQFINNDFNRILLISSLLVLCSLLISFGRLELTVFAFLPLVISWLWVLGIMGMLGIPFNIISIIISTFIFGLCDDYSIFISEGLQQEYKTGKPHLATHKAAILMSALITIIGIGVLVFAKHPALKSISYITVIGMLSVILISFTVQPVLFRFFITARTEKGYAPMTFWTLLTSIYTFGQFTIGCLLITAYCAVFLFPPYSNQTLRKRILHRLICHGTHFFHRTWFWVKYTNVGLSKDTFSKPAIFICNHQSHIDLIQVQSYTPRMVLMTNEWTYHSPLFGKMIQMADYQYMGNGIEAIVEPLRKKFDEGYSILIFPEGTRSRNGKIGRFHKGAFYLAEQLKADVIPMLLHGNCDVLAKGELHVKGGKLTVKFLPRIAWNDTRFGTDYSTRTKNIATYFRQEFEQLKRACENGKYLFRLLMRAYIFKGPVVEWYTRIKGKSEGYYEFFNSIIPRQCTITDIGCGNGMMAHMLSLFSEERSIVGVDYDAEKIELANSVFFRRPNVRFETADITIYRLQCSDVFLLSDVLHYLSAPEQQDVLNRCLQNLNPGGCIIIRDGVKELAGRFEGTRWSEIFSTRIFNYNKAERPLEFLSEKFIRAFAASNGLTVEMIDNTTITSNLTFILRRQ